VSERVRLCNHENAVKFLDAMTYEKDDVFLDFNTSESVFDADRCCHNSCFKQYVHLSKQSDI